MEELFNNFKSSFDEFYKKKLVEYQKDISINLNNEYTENYGKLQNVNSLNENCYYIHSQKMTSCSGGYSYTINILIDNYGNYQNQLIKSDASYPERSFQQTQCKYTYDNYKEINSFFSFGDRSTDFVYKSNKILPNKLIDIIKNWLDIFCSQTNSPYGIRIVLRFLKIINEISEDYYNRFTKYNTLYKSGELIKYDDVLKKIDMLNGEIESLKKIIKSLVEKNTELTNENNILRDNELEKEMLIEKNKELNKQIKNLHLQTNEKKEEIQKKCNILEILEKEIMKLREENRKLKTIDNNFKNLLSSIEE